MIFALALLLSSLLSCTAPLPKDESAGGLAAVRYECARCHSSPGRLAPVPRERDCTGCHQAIFAGAFRLTHTRTGIARWKQNIRSLRFAPTLVGTERFRADWLDRFLAQPHDLRPNLPASMPRMPISDADRAALITWLGAEPGPTGAVPDVGGDPAAGRALLQTRGCGGCHAFTGTDVLPVPPTPDPSDEARILAPDLRHTRARMMPETVQAWLADPSAIKPDTLMPRPALSESEQRDVVSAIFETPLEPVASHTFQRLPLLERPITYPEVEEAVFHRVCWHCHSDPSGNSARDGGPGNTGGFGYPGAGIDLGSREGILASGTLEGDSPLLITVMLRRHQEVDGHVPERPGMPLGLPPLSAEQIQLVESWIAQGAPP